MAKELTKVGKTASNGKTKSINGAKKPLAVKELSTAAPELELDEDASTSESEDEEEGQDVSKKGLARLMEALGEDGLSEMDRAHLGLVTGEMEDDEDSEVDDENEDGEENDEDNVLEEDSRDEELDEEVEEEINEAIESALPASKGTNGKDSLTASLARSGLIAEEEEEASDQEEEEDDPEGIPLESLSEAALAALPESVRATRMYREKINNHDALRRIRDDIALGADSKKGSLPWIETLVVTYDKSIEEEVGGQESNATDDDLKRELAFYKQALHTATQGRQLAKQANLPFTRPSDYFAEMVKSDEHMERVRQKLLDERAGLKASEEAKRQRELKKFGKKVQVEKQLERTKSRKDMDEKIRGLKRKHKGGLDVDDDDDDFDVQLESAISDKDNKRAKYDSSSRGRGGGRGGRGGPKMKRDARDAKFGHGGKKRHIKENTRESTNDTSGGVYRENRGGGRGGFRGGRGGRGGARGGSSSRGASKRPGKARRSGGRS